jgi:hypothetical protein
MSPENFETMAFLGHYPVRCKFFVDNKCPQQAKNLDISVVKFPMELKGILKKIIKGLFHLPTLMHNFYSLTICMLHYNPRRVSSINMPIFRRTNCSITASGIVTLCKRLHSMPDDPAYCTVLYRE